MHQPRSDPIKRMERKNNLAFCVVMILFLVFVAVMFCIVEYGLPAAQKGAEDNTPGKILLARFFIFLAFGQ